MRTFQLDRKEDVSGVSGTGIVAEGVQFSNGKVVISWLTEHTSVAVYDSLEAAMAVHCHGGRTRVIWAAGSEGEPVERLSARDNMAS